MSLARPNWAIVIHGGAGVIERTTMTPEREAAYRAALSAALETGSKVLRGGGPSLDAVEAAIRLMEDDPLFNAGRGSVFTAEGRNELDASIMDGATLKAGAVAGVTRTRHPISLARTVMEKSPHVMLSGAGADSFAGQHGLEQVDPSFFFTERRWKELEKLSQEQGEPMPSGTVGAVAMDSGGNLAAGTSTGGMTGKRWGRVGDSAIIGAGTYASNQSCAVSGTGFGEFFIRLTVAREVCALVEYKKCGLQQAADEVVHQQLASLKGTGGLIAVSPQGDTAWSFNTPGMYRGSETSVRPPRVAVFNDELS